MSCFKKVSTVTADRVLDATKHVNYTSGMILGVDDFTQEFAYLAGRDRWLARDAVGFGTISGLKVQVEQDADKGARVMVSPGVAVSPRGQFICVSAAQCAYLNEWLAANREDLKKRVKPIAASPPTSPPALADLTLYVVLCYRDCPVDQVPIPGEPCRSEEDLMEPSRIQDDFSLELRFDAPKQAEEDKLREFAEWLRQIKIVETGESTPVKEFVEGVRLKWRPLASPPETPPETSPPAEPLRINAADISRYLRIAFGLWVTELRNVLSEKKTGCAVEMAGGAGLEDCVLLSALRVPLVAVSEGFKVSDAAEAIVDEAKRPFVLHLRMLQEWLLANFAHSSGTAPAPVSEIRLDNLTNVETLNPKDGQVLMFDGGTWVNKNAESGGGGGATNHKDLFGLKDDDHEQYLLIAGTRAMKGDLNGGGNRITNLKRAAGNGEAVVFEQAVKQEDEAKGDLGGKYPAPIVTGLQGIRISPNKPKQDDVLIFRDGAWIPQPQLVVSPAPAQRQPLVLPFATITKVRNPANIPAPAFEIWFNIDAPGNLVKVADFKEEHLQIIEEAEKAPTFQGAKIRFTIAPGVRNVFICTIAPTPAIPPADTASSDKLRFRFDMTKIGVEITNRSATEKMILAEYADKSNINFMGSADGKTVTVFARGDVSATLLRPQ